MYTLSWSKDGKTYEYVYPVSAEEGARRWKELQAQGYKYGGYSLGDRTKELEEQNKKSGMGRMLLPLAAAAVVLILFMRKK
jgi:hypothetical protein